MANPGITQGRLISMPQGGDILLPFFFPPGYFLPPFRPAAGLEIEGFKLLKKGDQGQFSVGNDSHLGRISSGNFRWVDVDVNQARLIGDVKEGPPTRVNV